VSGADGPGSGVRPPAGLGQPAEDRWLLAGRHEPAARSLPLELATRLLFRSILLLSVYLLLVGHYHTGGGFAAGLVAGTAFTLRYVAGGPRELRAAMPFDPGQLLGAGLLLALATGAGAWVFGEPLLTSAYLSTTVPVVGEVAVVTSVVFDVGIYLLVIGAVVEMLRVLGVYGAPEVQTPAGRELR
jgi:multisubunit Na+/H+ antiporter MnhB subunit